MNLAIRDTYRHPCCRGGVGYYTIFLAEALSKIVETVDVFTGEPEAFPTCKTIVDNWTLSRTGPKRGLLLMKRILCPESVSTDYRCVIFPHPIEPLLKTCSTNRVMVVHDLIPLIHRRYSTRDNLYYIYYKYYLPHVLRKVDKVVVPSLSTKNDLLKTYNLSELKIHVIPNGFNYHLICNGKESHRRQHLPAGVRGDYVVYIGNSSAHKNIGRLIQAVSKVKKNIKLSLVLAGAYETKSYRELVRGLEMESCVNFLGLVSDEELATILSKARALIQPSLYEGFGLPPLEAMAMGIPVAASNSASLPEVCGKAAVYFDPYNVQEMAKAIESVLVNEEMRNNCIHEGFKQAKKFDWSLTAKRFVEMIAEL